MADTKDYSSTAANNTDAPPDGAPEGMLAASVNNTMRQMMANQKGSSLFTVDSLAAMKALDVAKITTGNSFYLKGLTVNGTGSGVFRYDSGSAATTDDIDVVQPTAGAGRFLRSDVQTTSVTSSGKIQASLVSSSPQMGIARTTTSTGAFDFGAINNELRITDADNGGAAVLNISKDNAVYPGIFSKNGNHPAFSAAASAQNNVTGDGTVYSILFANERYDQGANFASPNFTAPITGKYTLSWTVEVTGASGASSVVLELVTSNKTYRIGIDLTGAAQVLFGGALDVDMDASDTAKINVTSSGLGLVVDISSTSNFTGHLSA